MGAGRKILEEIHPLTLIREVQKWPVIYVRDNPDRTNSHFKKKVWTEIAKVLFTDWDTYSVWEQESKVSDLIKKWRNLRDTFKRQLETEKKIREGHEITKKPYVYFKYMLYLLPHIGDAAPDPTVEPKLEEFFVSSAKRKKSNIQKEKKKKRKRLQTLEPVKSVIIPETPSKSTDTDEDIDEDKHFLMSLVPSFKRMNDDEKLEAKVEILKVIKGLRKNTRSNNDSLECNNGSDLMVYNIDDYKAVKVEMITGDTDPTLQDEGDCSEESDDSENSN